MPEYIPTPQFPTALAAENGRMAQQNAQIIPQAIQQMVQSLAQGYQQRLQRQQNTLTPEQIQAMGIHLQNPTPVPPGWQGPRPPMSPEQTGQVFPHGMPLPVANMYQNEQMRQATMANTQAYQQGMLGIKSDALKKNHFEVSQEELDKNPKWAAQGIKVGDMLPDAMRVNVSKPAAGAQNAMTDEAKKGIAADLAAGKLAGSELQQVLGRGSPKDKSDIYMMAKKINPNLNISQGNTAIVGAHAGARFQESGPGQMVARVANSAMEQLDALQTASDNFPRTNVQLLNTPILKIDEQTMPEAQAWKIALTTARMEYATALNRGNSPNHEQEQEAARALPDSITMRQLPAAIKQLRIGLTNTVKGMTKRAAPAGETPVTDNKQSAADYVKSLGL